MHHSQHTQKIYIFWQQRKEVCYYDLMVHWSAKQHFDTRKEEHVI